MEHDRHQENVDAVSAGLRGGYFQGMRSRSFASVGNCSPQELHAKGNGPWALLMCRARLSLCEKSLVHPADDHLLALFRVGGEVLRKPAAMWEGPAAMLAAVCADLRVRLHVALHFSPAIWIHVVAAGGAVDHPLASEHAILVGLFDGGANAGG
jgi:hypothetical protein